jgi:hypothetical protein
VSSSAVAAEGGASSSFGEIIVDLVVLLAPEKSRESALRSASSSL